MFLVFFLICSYWTHYVISTQWVEFFDYGQVEFNDTYTLEWSITNQSLLFVKADVYLKVNNTYDNLFFLNGDVTDYYVNTMNQTLMIDHVVIDSFGLTEMTYEYWASYTVIANNASLVSPSVQMQAFDIFLIVLIIIVGGVIVILLMIVLVNKIKEWFC